MSEESCETVTCSSEARLACHWPSRTLAMCLPCAIRAIRVAQHLGFSLTVTALGRTVARGEKVQ